MKSRRIVFMLAGICVLFFVSSLAMAGTPSAKFAATWTTEPGLASVAEIEDASVDSIDFDLNMGYTLATIKVPQDKELLVGVSAEIGLITDTSIKGKEGGAAKAIAGGAGWVTILAIPKEGENGTCKVARPGTVVLSARFQALEATLGGVLQSCTDIGTFSVESGVCVETLTDGQSVPDGTITAGCECTFTDEEIGLLLATCAAHHFNFVLPNMDQGVYNIVAFFTTAALAGVDITTNVTVNPFGTVSASAYAKAVIGKTMLTVQQVRAAEDGLQDTEIEPWP